MFILLRREIRRTQARRFCTREDFRGRWGRNGTMIRYRRRSLRFAGLLASSMKTNPVQSVSAALKRIAMAFV